MTMQQNPKSGPMFALKLALAGMLIAAPGVALADVNAGVAAWERGEYDSAVAEWRGPAGQGDADAQFNLGQAYRLGRGVDQNTRQAELFYAQAAAQGHVKAADNLGLLLFQDGRQQDAMPYVLDAASRGDPRSQYLLGIAHFNGDLVERDWVRAYALITLANSAGLPQASSAVQQMDQHIPLAQRQQAQVLVPQLKRDADARRATRLAAVDLGTNSQQPISDAGSRAAPAGSMPNARVPQIPRPVPEVRVAPSVAAAQAAIAEASRVTGTESPAEAGATFASRSTAAPAPGRVEAQPATQVVARPVTQPVQQPASRPVTQPVAVAVPTPTASRAGSGQWKIQLGAFAVDGNAERLWAKLSGRAELAGASRILEPSGRVTKLLAGGYASQSDAQNACNALKRRGQECIVTR